MNNKGSYPQQAVYPQQSSAPIYPPAMQVSPQAPPYTDAPPAYSEIYQPRYVHPSQAGQLQQMAQYPGTQMYMQLPQSMAVGPMGHNVPMAYYPMGAMYPPGSTVLVEGGYDAAQLAAMQGANVMMTQRKNNFFMGGSNGGYTIW
ncbi:unnamed protein product [Coregonus sp. 'balchen']|nr:unnamed protein product [Coregonus sp. 'balchen']